MKKSKEGDIFVCPACGSEELYEAMIHRREMNAPEEIIESYEAVCGQCSTFIERDSEGSLIVGVSAPLHKDIEVGAVVRTVNREQALVTEIVKSKYKEGYGVYYAVEQLGDFTTNDRYWFTTNANPEVILDSEIGRDAMVNLFGNEEVYYA